jgi:hypothetical protein
MPSYIATLIALYIFFSKFNSAQLISAQLSHPTSQASKHAILNHNHRQQAQTFIDK